MKTIQLTSLLFLLLSCTFLSCKKSDLNPNNVSSTCDFDKIDWTAFGVDRHYFGNITDLAALDNGDIVFVAASGNYSINYVIRYSNGKYYILRSSDSFFQLATHGNDIYIAETEGLFDPQIIFKWNKESGDFLQLTYGYFKCYELKVNPNGDLWAIDKNILYAIDPTSGFIKSYGLDSRVNIDPFNSTYSFEHRNLDFSPDGKTLYLTGRDALVSWKINKGESFPFGSTGTAEFFNYPDASDYTVRNRLKVDPGTGVVYAHTYDAGYTYKFDPNSKTLSKLNYGTKDIIDGPGKTLLVRYGIGYSNNPDDPKNHVIMDPDKCDKYDAIKNESPYVNPTISVLSKDGKTLWIGYDNYENSEEIAFVKFPIN